MAIALNPAAVTFAKKLIEAGKIQPDAGHWGQHNPDPAHQNTFLQQHSMAEYANWHLAVDAGHQESTKGRYKFPYGDFQTVHRDGLIAAKERAAQQGYHDVAKAADELLGLLEEAAK
ncbi:hypothetical protein [Hymenobacter coccineus]|uniref:Uncharacterized protein n=1 Tax=Hymenobacter coccineus TaxID=1908235 RepID=A0A1G1TDN5_9BACT|nr:hypothetical protein [Hymenobacter coccineus]OGX88982.1 hypothetical protein BEN49_01210 [Hymenobacter coccineus]